MVPDGAAKTDAGQHIINLMTKPKLVEVARKRESVSR
jgi:hypothetical protein